MNLQEKKLEQINFHDLKVDDTIKKIATNSLVTWPTAKVAFIFPMDDDGNYAFPYRIDLEKGTAFRQDMGIIRRFFEGVIVLDHLVLSLITVVNSDHAATTPINPVDGIVYDERIYDLGWSVRGAELLAITEEEWSFIDSTNHLIPAVSLYFDAHFPNSQASTEFPNELKPPSLPVPERISLFRADRAN